MLLPRAEAADHAIRMLVRVGLRAIMALVARVHLHAAREAEPAVALGVMLAAAAVREFLAGDDAEVLFGGFAPEREQVPRVQGLIGDEHELRFGQREAHVGVAGAADGDAGGGAPDRGNSGGGDGRGARGARGNEDTRQHIEDGTAGEIEVAGSGGVGVHKFGAVSEGAGLGAFGTRVVGLQGGREEIGVPAAFGIGQGVVGLLRFRVEQSLGSGVGVVQGYG